MSDLIEGDSFRHTKLESVDFKYIFPQNIHTVTEAVVMNYKSFTQLLKLENYSLDTWASRFSDLCLCWACELVIFREQGNALSLDVWHCPWKFERDPIIVHRLIDVYKAMNQVIPKTEEVAMPFKAL